MLIIGVIMLVAVNTSAKTQQKLNVDKQFSFPSEIDVNIDSVKSIDSLINILNKIANKKSETDVMYVVVLPAVGAILLAILAPFINELIKDSRKTKNERKRLFEELCDIIRHCNRNLLVLNAINARIKNDLPDTLHYEKMKIPHNSLLFSLETFRNLDYDKCQRIYQLKLILRNININLNGVINYCKRRDATRESIISYNKYIANHMVNARANLRDGLAELDKAFIANSTSRKNEIDEILKKKATGKLTKEEKIKLIDYSINTIGELTKDEIELDNQAFQKEEDIVKYEFNKLEIRFVSKSK